MTGLNGVPQLEAVMSATLPAVLAQTVLINATRPATVEGHGVPLTVNVINGVVVPLVADDVIQLSIDNGFAWNTDNVQCVLKNSTDGIIPTTVTPVASSDTELNVQLGLGALVPANEPMTLVCSPEIYTPPLTPAPSNGVKIAFLSGGDPAKVIAVGVTTQAGGVGLAPGALTVEITLLDPSIGALTGFTALWSSDDAALTQFDSLTFELPSELVFASNTSAAPIRCWFDNEQENWADFEVTLTANTFRVLRTSNIDPTRVYSEFSPLTLICENIIQLPAVIAGPWDDIEAAILSALDSSATLETTQGTMNAVIDTNIAAGASFILGDPRVYSNTFIKANFTVASTSFFSSNVEIYMQLPYDYSADSYGAVTCNMSIDGGATNLPGITSLKTNPLRFGYSAFAITPPPQVEVPVVTVASSSSSFTTLQGEGGVDTIFTCQFVRNARSLLPAASQTRAILSVAIAGKDPNEAAGSDNTVGLPEVVPRVLGQQTRTLTVSSNAPNDVVSVTLTAAPIAEDVSLRKGEIIGFALPPDYAVASTSMTQCTLTHAGAAVPGMTYVDKALRLVQFTLFAPLQVSGTSTPATTVLKCDRIRNPVNATTTGATGIRAYVLSSEGGFIAERADLTLPPVAPFALGTANNMVAVRNINGEYRYNVNIKPLNWQFVAGDALRFDWPTTQRLYASTNCRVKLGGTTSYAMAAKTTIDLSNRFVQVVLLGSYSQIPQSSNNELNVECDPVSDTDGVKRVHVLANVTVQAVNPSTNAIYGQSTSTVTGSLSPPPSLFNPFGAIVDLLTRVVTAPVVVVDVIGNLIMNFDSDVGFPRGTIITVFAPAQERAANDANLACLVNGMVVETRRDAAAAGEIVIILSDALLYVPNQILKIQCRLEQELIELIPLRLEDGSGNSVNAGAVPSVPAASLARIGSWELSFESPTPNRLLISASSLNATLSSGDYSLLTLPQGFSATSNPNCSVLALYAGALTAMPTGTTMAQGQSLRVTADSLWESTGAPQDSLQFLPTGAVRGTDAPTAAGPFAPLGLTWWPGAAVKTDFNCSGVTRDTPALRYAYSANGTVQAAGVYVSGTLVATAPSSAVNFYVAPVAQSPGPSTVYSITTDSSTVYVNDLVTLRATVTALPANLIPGDVVAFAPPPGWDLTLAQTCGVQVTVGATVGPVIPAVFVNNSGDFFSVTVPGGIPTPPLVAAGAPIPAMAVTISCYPVRTPLAPSSSSTEAAGLWEVFDSRDALVTRIPDNSTTVVAIVVAPFTSATGMLVFPYASGPTNARLYFDFSTPAEISPGSFIDLAVGDVFGPSTVPAALECRVDGIATAAAATFAPAPLGGARTLRIAAPATGVPGGSVHRVVCGDFAAAAAPVAARTAAVGQVTTAGGDAQAVNTNVAVSGAWDPSTFGATYANITFSDSGVNKPVTATIALALPFTLPAGSQLSVTMPDLAWGVSDVQVCSMTPGAIGGAADPAPSVTTVAIDATAALPSFVITMPVATAAVGGTTTFVCDSVRTPLTLPSDTVNAQLALRYAPLQLAPEPAAAERPLVMDFAAELPPIAPGGQPLETFINLISTRITIRRASVLSASERQALLEEFSEATANLHASAVYVYRQTLDGAFVTVEIHSIPSSVVPGLIPGLLTLLQGVLIGLRSQLAILFGVGTVQAIEPPAAIQLPSTCFNDARDGSETARDCGGPSCRSCEDYDACDLNRDCLSTNCAEDDRCRYGSTSTNPAAAAPGGEGWIAVAVTAACAVVGYYWLARDNKRDA
jgi:hypothetical protein